MKIRSTSIYISGVLGAGLLLLPTAALADNPPNLPMSISGMVATSSGAPIASGTVQAFLNGQPDGSIAINTDGSFGNTGLHQQLLLPGTPADYGEAVTFTVNGLPVTASQAVYWHSGQIVTQLLLAIPDAQAVQADTSSLSIGYLAGDSAGDVSQNLSLPTSGFYGSAISWSSDRPDIIANNGTVTRSVYGDVAVHLTATLTNGTASDTKQFALTVKQQPLTQAQQDAQAVAADKAALTIGFGLGDSVGSVIQNVTMPTSGPNGTTISWSSSNPAVIANDGTVTRPSYLQGDATVTLTAVIQKGSASDTQSFSMTVKAKDLTSLLDINQDGIVTIDEMEKLIQSQTDVDKDGTFDKNDVLLILEQVGSYYGK